MPRPKPLNVDTEERRVVVAREYRRGSTLHDLAKRFGCSHVTIYEDVQVIKKRWKESQASGYSELVDQELQRIDEREREAWRGWKRSLRTATKKTAKQQQGESVKSETALVQEDQAGDPRFLAVIAQCSDQRCKLLGLYAPEKIQDVTETKTVEVLVTSRTEVLTVKELLAGGNATDNDTTTDTPADS